MLNHRGGGDARALTFGSEVIVKQNGHFYYLTENDLEHLDVLGFRTDHARCGTTSYNAPCPTSKPRA